MELRVGVDRRAASILAAAIVLIVLGGLAVAYNTAFDPAVWDGTPRVSPSPSDFGHTADEIYGLKEAFCMVNDDREGCQGSGGSRLVGVEVKLLEAKPMFPVEGSRSTTEVVIPKPADADYALVKMFGGSHVVIAPTSIMREHIAAYVDFVNNITTGAHMITGGARSMPFMTSYINYNWENQPLGTRVSAKENSSFLDPSGPVATIGNTFAETPEDYFLTFTVEGSNLKIGDFKKYWNRNFVVEYYKGVVEAQPEALPPKPTYYTMSPGCLPINAPNRSNTRTTIDICITLYSHANDTLAGPQYMYYACDGVSFVANLPLTCYNELWTE